MTPEYLEQLAVLADPEELWRMSGIQQMDLPMKQRRQLDSGVALRRHASHIRTLAQALVESKSLCITPLSTNGAAICLIVTPAKHEKLKRQR